MLPSEIQACLERANEVINGFKKPSEMNARDVVNLVRHIVSLRDTKEPNRATYTDSTPDFLKDLFR